MSSKPSHPRAISTTKLTEHRGARRLWIEGRKLERGGISPGDRFAIAWDPATRQVTLEFRADGDRKVSQRNKSGKAIPIVDVNTRDIEEALGPGIERAKVSIYNKRIVVEVHPDDRDAQERLTRLADKIRKGEPISTGSLAHGGGILDHAIHTGLKDKGIQARLAFACEWDEPTLDAAATNNSVWSEETLQIEASMDDIEVRDLPDIDVLIAGLPCVGASRAGKAKNGLKTAEEHETAGHLFITFLAIVRAKNPSILLIENVPEFASEISADMIRKVLGIRGYQISEAILEGNAFGALEMRRRWCMLATSPELKIRLADLMPVREKEATLADILDHVPLDDDRWKDIQYMHEKAERDRLAGKNFSPNFVSPEATWIRSMGASYWKWRPTEPKIPHPTKPGFARILSPAEHARAKTVPPELVAGISNTLAHSILGSSVVHAAWQSVGRHLGDRMLAMAMGEVVDATPIKEAIAGLPLFDLAEDFDEEAPAPAM